MTRQAHDNMVDVWSLGVLMYEFLARRPSPPLAAPRRPSSRTPRCHAPCAPHGLTRALAAQVGTPPFEAQGHHETYKKISKVDIKWPSHISSDAKDLISKLLVKDPSQRMALDQVANHPWIKKHCPAESK